MLSRAALLSARFSVQHAEVEIIDHLARQQDAANFTHEQVAVFFDARACD